MKGVCLFHSETGTEGGYWAFQDERFMGIPNNSMTCSKCYRYGYYEKSGPNDAGQPFDYRNDLEEQKRWVIEQERQLEEMRRTKHVDLPFFESAPRYCDPGTHDWQLAHPQGTWSYEGLHVLENGDQLTIFDKDDPSKKVWHGVIDLTEFTVFEEDFKGLWSHNRQKNVDMDVWGMYFLNEHPAELIQRGQTA